MTALTLFRAFWQGPWCVQQFSCSLVIDHSIIITIGKQYSDLLHHVYARANLGIRGKPGMTEEKERMEGRGSLNDSDEFDFDWGSSKHHAIGQDKTLPFEPSQKDDECFTEGTDSGAELRKGTPSLLSGISKRSSTPLGTLLNSQSGCITLVVCGALDTLTTVKKLVSEFPASFVRVVSHTTRKKKELEVDGRDYHFISNDEMEQLVQTGEMIEYSSMMDGRSKGSTERYGTAASSIHFACQRSCPCIIINTILPGAVMLRHKGVDGHFVVIHSDVYREETEYGVKFVLPPDHSDVELVKQVQADIVLPKDSVYLALKEFALNILPSTEPPAHQEYLEAVSEWEQIASIQPAAMKHVTFHPVTYAELQQYFQTARLEQQRMKIQPKIHRGGVKAITHKIFGTKLRKSLHSERDLFFTIAKCQFDDSIPLHFRTLQTIYCRLTGAKVQCPRYGKHWQDIGFQQSDPATDLRGTGFLSLLHLMYTLSSSDTISMMINIYKLSKDTSQHFPLCALAINVTQQTMVAMRDETLAKLCNHRDEVFNVTNEYFSASLHLFYCLWRRHKKTIAECANVLQQVELIARSDPNKLIGDYKNTLLQQYQPRVVTPTNDQPIKFTNINNLPEPNYEHFV